MDFFSNILKTTVNKVETLSKTASAAVNSQLNPNGSDDGDQSSAVSGDQQQQISTDNDEYLTNNNDCSTATARSSVQENDINNDGGQQRIKSDSLASEEKQQQSFNSAEYTQKAFESAKFLGNVFMNVANKAGQTVTATAKQIKTTVESVGIMQDFTKEQQEFIKEHGGKTDITEPPWRGCDNEEQVKQEILALSQDKRNFVRSPPAGVAFDFDMNASYPVALAMLREDQDLSKMRYEIVPKLVNEETFWRNYFYRVSLIKQDPNFTTATSGETAGGVNTWVNSSRSSSSEGPDDPNEQSEFVSDTFQSTTNISVDDVRKDMYKLGIQTAEDFDAELAKDLQEFEVLGGPGSVPSASSTGIIDDDEINRELANFDMK